MVENGRNIQSSKQRPKDEAKWLINYVVHLFARFVLVIDVEHEIIEIRLTLVF